MRILARNVYGELGKYSLETFDADYEAVEAE